MHQFIKWGLRLSILMYGLLHFITFFYENEGLTQILWISGFFILMFSAVFYGVNKIKLPLFLFLTGIAIIMFTDGHLIEGFRNGLLQMRSIISLLIIIPLISWVLREEPYLEAIMNVGHHLLDTGRKFYFGMISFIQIVAYFLLFGSIPMMYQFVNMILKSETGEAWEKFKGTAMLRGFALSVMWVVSIPSFIFVVDTMEASLWISIFQGLGMSIVGVLIALVFLYIDEKKYGIDFTSGIRKEIDDVLEHGASIPERKKKTAEFMVLFVTLFGSILVLHEVFSIDLMVIIPLVVLVWTAIYYVSKRRLYKFFQEMRIHVENDMLHQGYQLSILLGAGMMIFSLNQTGFGDMAVNAINQLQGTLPFVNILYFLPFMVIVLGFLGLGPLTVMVLIAGILESLALPYPPELIVMAITSGSAISILLSPLILPVIVLSGSNGLSVYKNGVGFNLSYAFVIYVVVQIYIQTMIHVFSFS